MKTKSVLVGLLLVVLWSAPSFAQVGCTPTPPTPTPTDTPTPTATPTSAPTPVPMTILMPLEGQADTCFMEVEVTMSAPVVAVQMTVPAISWWGRGIRMNAGMCADQYGDPILGLPTGTVCYMFAPWVLKNGSRTLQFTGLDAGGNAVVVLSRTVNVNETYWMSFPFPRAVCAPGEDSCVTGCLRSDFGT